MRILVFGNPLVEQDSAPLRMLPRLREEFPEIDFKELDAVEDLEDEGSDLVIIDTVKGIDRIQVFNGLDPFSDSPRCSLHDFDLLSYLKILEKLGKLRKVRIIGCPVSCVRFPESKTQDSRPETQHRQPVTGHRELLTDLVSAIREVCDREEPEKNHKKGA